MKDQNNFEVSRTHLPLNEPIAERCSDDSCTNKHFWSVYQRIPSAGLPDGVADWVSDHATEQHARTAAAAYEFGAASTVLLENVAAVTCVIAHEVAKEKPNYEDARLGSSRAEGWPGFLWSMIRAGLALTDMEAESSYGVDFEWYDTVDRVADAFTVHYDSTREEWKPIIAKIFEQLRTKNSTPNN